MKFKQKSILYWEIIVFDIFCLVISVVLMAYDSLFLAVLIIPFLLFCLVLIIQLFLQKEYIIINEEGIACVKGQEILWKYNWFEIAELKIGNRFRNPSIEIILKEDCYKERSNAYFQLGLTAKKAIKLYYRNPIRGRFCD